MKPFSFNGAHTTSDRAAEGLATPAVPAVTQKTSAQRAPGNLAISASRHWHHTVTWPKPPDTAEPKLKSLSLSMTNDTLALAGLNKEMVVTKGCQLRIIALRQTHG